MPVARLYGEGNATLISTTRSIVRGNTARLYLLKRTSTVTTHELGFDVLERKYYCHRSRVEQFMPRRGDIDFEHQQLVYWSHSRARKGEFVEITVRFNGYLQPRARVVIPRDSTAIVELPMTSVSGNLQLTLIYETNRVAHRYANPVRPLSTEPFAMPVSLPRIEILAIKGAANIELTDFKKSWLIETFGLIERNRRVAFDRNPEGAVWMCDEVIERQLVQRAVAISI